MELGVKIAAEESEAVVRGHGCGLRAQFDRNPFVVVDGELEPTRAGKALAGKHVSLSDTEIEHR